MENSTILQQSNEETQEKKQVEKPNKIGMAGFILSLLGLLFFWVPILSCIFWLTGLIFSIIGICRPKKMFPAIGIAITCVSCLFVLFFSMIYLRAYLEYRDPGQYGINQVAGELGQVLSELDDVQNSNAEYVEIRGKKGNTTLYLGMPKDSVMMLVGKPDKTRLYSIGNTAYETWGYMLRQSYIENLRLEFRNGRLTGVDQD